MPRRSAHRPQPLVPLSDTERQACEVLALHGRGRQLRADAQALLADGAPEHDLHDLRRAVLDGLRGHAAVVERWGACSRRALELAADRVRHLQDSALWVTVVHEVGNQYPCEPTYLGCIWGPPGSGLAWPLGSGVDPRIPVRRWPEPEQMELFEEE